MQRKTKNNTRKKIDHERDKNEIKNKMNSCTYHIVMHNNDPTIREMMTDSLLFFFWIPSISRVNEGTLAVKERKRKKGEEEEEKRKEGGQEKD